MIKILKQYFNDVFDDTVYEDKDRTLRLACTVMMFEVLRSDANEHPAEITKIRQHVTTAFELDPQETEQLIRLARHETEHAISLHEVIRAVNEVYQPDEKRQLIKMLWDVAYADGELDKYEEHTIRKLADWLHVSHRDFILMKHEAAGT
jgi:uncharacterized tellurite resistance protein B-like protein